MDILKDNQLRKCCKGMVSMLCLISMIVGLLCIVGWITNTYVLVGIYKTFAPMKIKTAIMTILCSASYLLLFRNKRKMAILCDLLLIALCIIFLLEWINNKEFITTPFKQWLEMPEDIAAQYSPISLIYITCCFLLLGLTILIIALPNKLNPLTKLLFSILTITNCFLAFISLVNYFGGLYASFQIHDLTIVSLNTTIALMLLSISGVLINNNLLSAKPIQRIYFNSTLVFCLLISSVSAVLGQLSKQTKINIQYWLSSEIEELVYTYQQRLKERFVENTHFSYILPIVTNKTDYLFDINVETENLFTQQKALECVVIYDEKENKTLTICKKGLNHQRIEFLKSISLNSSINKNLFVLNDSFANNPLLIFESFERREGKAFSVNFLYNTELFFQPLPTIPYHDYDIEHLIVIIGDVVVYTNTDLEISKPLEENELYKKKSFVFDGLSIDVHLWSTKKFQVFFSGEFPFFLLFGGSILACLLTLIVFILQRYKLTNDALIISNKAKTIFLSNVSHEIRTPLHDIIGNGSLLSETTDLDSKQKKHVDRILFSARYLLELVNNLLDITKYETQTFPILLEACDIETICHEQLQILLEQAKSKNLLLNFSFFSETEKRVITTPRLIKQIITNLVSNAIKFTDSGHVDVNVRVDALTKQNGELILKVEDTGIGISKDKLPLLFGKFSRIEDTTLPHREGSGLGLYLIKIMIEKMKGKISVESTFGKGSIFTVVLPVHFEIKENE